jgi:hypothetical protein
LSSARRLRTMTVVVPLRICSWIVMFHLTLLSYA